MGWKKHGPLLLFHPLWGKRSSPTILFLQKFPVKRFCDDICDGLCLLFSPWRQATHRSTDPQILSSRSVIYSYSSKLRLSRSIFSPSMFFYVTVLLRIAYKQQILFLNVFQTLGRLSCCNCFQGQNRRPRAFEKCLFKIKK